MDAKEYLKSLIASMEMGSEFPVQISELKMLLMFMMWETK